MKYKVGDKVKIKYKDYYGFECSKALMKLIDFTAPIKYIEDRPEDKDFHYYNMEEISWAWYESDIECLASKYKDPESEPVLSRFEILDL